MNYNNDVEYVTEEGLQAIKDELKQLTTVVRDELSEKLRIAISQGDLKENADYHDAKERQGFTEARIRDLEDALRRAQVITDPVNTDRVRVGSRVTVSEEGYDEEETYQLVGAREADPSKGMVSNESPIGKALLGAKKGQTVEFESPGGTISFTVVSIK